MDQAGCAFAVANAGENPEPRNSGPCSNAGIRICSWRKSHWRRDPQLFDALMFRSPGGIAMDRTTEMLSSFVCDLNYNDLTPQTVHQVKRVLVDTLACAMGGYLSEPAKIARQLASTVKSDGENGSRILGTRECSSPEMAGFANAVMVRYLDYNDMSVGGHPSDSIPGPLAVAYPRGNDGQAVITAIVVNYEAARQVGGHLQHNLQLGGDP